ncbi:hypothetical protein HOP50_16g78200 [Chloropicon primus]|nr:hypothetical protein HOP50_16g78200 [Chloropicon primus]
MEVARRGGCLCGARGRGEGRGGVRSHPHQRRSPHLDGHRHRTRGRARGLGFSSNQGSRSEETRRVKEVNRASALLQTIIDEVSREHFIDTAALIIEDDEREGIAGDGDLRSTEAMAQVARKVCRVYMDELDNVFLATLLAYIQAAKDQDREDVVELLNCVYEQIILLLRMDLPGGIQCVDILTQVVGKADRERVMRRARDEAGRKNDGRAGSGERAEGEESDGVDKLEVPPCEPVEVFGACQEMFRQMETQDAFDKLLYYRVCCVSEEVRDFAQAFETEETAIAKVYPHALPSRELGLIKELLKVSDAQRIKAILNKSFAEFDVLQADFDFSDSGEAKPEGGRAGGMQGQAEGGAINVVPHKLLECLAALLYESEMEDNQRLDDGSTGPGGRPSKEVVQQMRVIRSQALLALLELAQLGSE